MHLINPNGLKHMSNSTQKRIRPEKNGGKDAKALYKLMSNIVDDRPMKNLRNRIDVRFASNEKDYLKWTSKPIKIL